MDTQEIQVGKTYRVNSSRKGTFTGKVTAINGEFADILITSGRAGAMMEYNEREEGEQVTVRMSLCIFTPMHIMGGTAYRVLAEFPETDEGRDAANAFMVENENAALLDTANGVHVLADKNDKGVPA